jgi:DNA-binding response OmpR family regulator
MSAGGCVPTPHFSTIPVMIHSVPEETKIKFEVFQSRGFDFIARPFDAEEVRARIEIRVGKRIRKSGTE